MPFDGSRSPLLDRPLLDRPLLDQIAELRPTLSPSSVRIADAISGDPAKVAQIGIVALAELAATSIGSVNRFCHAIGVDGYTALRLALAVEVGHNSTADPDADASGEIEPDADAASTLARIAASSMNAIRRSAALMDLETLDLLAETVEQAPQVQIFAFGGSAHIANYLVDQLVGIGISARTTSDATTAAAFAVTLRDRDVAIAISHSGTALHPLDLLDIARERGATTAAITSSAAAPLARHVDLALVTTARNASSRYRGTAGRHAQLFVTDALFVRVAQRRADISQQFLERAGQATAPYQSSQRHQSSQRRIPKRRGISQDRQPQADHTPLMVTDHASHQVIVLDRHKDWKSPDAQLWAWSPTDESKLSGPEGGWLHPDDARLRTLRSTGGQLVLVSDSYGLLAAVPYPDAGPVYWSASPGITAGPHGIELLPDGNIAAAASVQGWIRVYTASQGHASTNYAEAPLPGAHQVYWDQRSEVLWALGEDHLVSYTLGGTSAQPSLIEAGRHVLPTRQGHDLQPVPGDPDRLWIATTYGVHQFIKSTGKFRIDYPRHRELYRSKVKSVVTDARSGDILQTTPKPGNPSSYGTDQVDLFVGENTTETKILPNAQIYRARWFNEQST